MSMTDTIHRVRFAGVAGAICATAISVVGCSHKSEEPPPAMAPTPSEQATARPATDVEMQHPEQYQGQYQPGSASQQGSMQQGSMQQGSSQQGATDTTMMHPEQNAESAASGNQRIVTVTVKDVDRAAHMVTFQAHVKPEANIQRNGVPIQLDQLQPGDSVRMMVDTSTGDVTRVDVVKQAGY
jgi:hypothetical protein